MEKTIEQIAREYLKAKEHADRAKARQDEIAAQLKARLCEPINIDGQTIALQNRESISFDAALLPYLKANGLQTYVQETIDDAGLKKAIKNSKMLAEQIKVFTRVKTSQALIVKKAKV